MKRAFFRYARGLLGPWRIVSWEQRKLGDVASRVGDACDNPSLPQVEYEDINSGAGTLNKDLMTKETAKAGILFQPGDVITGKLRPYPVN